MNRFVIIDQLPFLLAGGKTYAVRWDEKGFTVGTEVKKASVPTYTLSEISIKAKCAGLLDSISVQAQEQEQEQQAQEQEPLHEMTVAELKEYAAAHGIDLGDAKKKSEIVEAIQDVMEK